MTIDKQAIEAAIRAFGDRAAQLIDLVLKDADTYTAGIERAINDNDPEAAGLAAHSLISIMKQINAINVSNLAFEIEKSGKEGNIDGCVLQWVPLQEDYKELKSFLQTL